MEGRTAQGSGPAASCLRQGLLSVTVSAQLDCELPGLLLSLPCTSCRSSCSEACCCIQLHVGSRNQHRASRWPVKVFTPRAVSQLECPTVLQPVMKCICFLYPCWEGVTGSRIVTMILLLLGCVIVFETGSMLVRFFVFLL